VSGCCAAIARLAARRKLRHTAGNPEVAATLRRALLMPAPLLATPAFAAEISCEGVFAGD